jgi:GPH family glycoside/pentoside/hexuronide:cation symporter
MNTTKLSTKEKIGYGLGDTASNFFFQTFNIFLLYYYTDVFGLAPAAVGTMFLLARFWDAVNDPMMGVVADRTVTKRGKYRPYLLWVAIPYGLLGYLIFANPDLGANGKLIYAYVTYIAMMMAYTAINVPYSALMGVMTPSSVERTSLSSYRFVCAFGGGFLVSLAVRPLVRELGGGDEVKGFQYTMAIFAVVSILLFWVTYATTRERVKPAVQKISLRGDFSALLRNTPWLVMVAAAVLTLSNVAVRGAVTVHYFKYVVGDTGESFLFGIDRTTLVMSSGMLAFIAGVFFTARVGRMLGKRNALMTCTLLNAATVIGFYFIPPDQYWVMVVVNLLGNLFAGPTPALVWAMYADVADYGEWKFGRRSTALVFSAAMFAQKMGLTIGGSLSGWMLGLYGFVPNQAQTPETLSGIRIMFCIVPGVLAVANGLVLLGYRLTDAKVAEIESDLAARRLSQNEG